jgi:hypothetical protein
MPEAVAAVVARLMAKRPDERYQTPAELAAALGDVPGRGPVATVAVTLDAGRTLLAAGNPFADIDVATADTAAAAPPEHRTAPAAARKVVLFAASGGTVLLLGALGLAIWLGSRATSGIAGAGQTRRGTEARGKEPPEEMGKAAGAILLFNGKDFTGWRPPNGGEVTGWQVGTARLPDGGAGLQVEPGGDELINVATGTSLVSVRAFRDCLVETEVLVGRGANSGIYLMGEYEVQVLDSFGKAPPTAGDMGALYNIAAPRVNACKKPGEWQTLLIDFHAPRFDGNKKVANGKLVRVVLNGQLIHENVDVPRVTEQGLTGVEHPTGPICLQGDHGGGVAFRNFRITPSQPSALTAGEVKKQQEDSARRLGVPAQ